MGFSNSGIPLGTVFALVATPYIVERLGWEWAFYLFGVLGVVWFAAWQRMVTAEPAQQSRDVRIRRIGHRISAPFPSFLTFSAPNLLHSRGMVQVGQARPRRLRAMQRNQNVLFTSCKCE